MIRKVVLVSAVVGLASAAWAEAVAPGEVVFEDGAVTQSLTGTAGDPMSGKNTMADRGLGNCLACHQVSDLAEEQFHGEIGPPLDGVGARWSEAELRGIVADAKQMFPGSMMPSFYKGSGFIRPGDGFTGKAATEEELEPLLTAQQVEDVVAYLLTLKD